MVYKKRYGIRACGGEEIKEVGSLKNIVKPSLKVELEGVDVVPVVCVVLSANLRGKIIFKISYTYF